MKTTLPQEFILSEEVNHARRLSNPIVALESAVITHGLPKPQNYSLAHGMEQAIRDTGVVPATIGVLDGKIHVGLTENELERLSIENNTLKIGPRDFSTAVYKKMCGGTTVAGTMFIAERVNIKVFATGGIGGVHDTESYDVSSDLQILANTPMIVVCSGAKAILDIPATLEYLETMSVPIVGFQTNEFPGFYTKETGKPINIRLETPNEVVDFCNTHWEIGSKSAVLICQAPPRGNTLPRKEIDELIKKARSEAEKTGITGQKLTPFLLNRLGELSGGETLRTNLALLLNNACLAAQISKVFYPNKQRGT